jgi:hypothetical protein
MSPGGREAGGVNMGSRGSGEAELTRAGFRLTAGRLEGVEKAGGTSGGDDMDADNGFIPANNTVSQLSNQNTRKLFTHKKYQHYVTSQQ